MNKVLFLDHDGVICLPDQWGNRYEKHSDFKNKNPEWIGQVPVTFRFDDFDPKAVTVLNEIIDKTDCEIVISSDWKLHATLWEMSEYYKEQGVNKTPIAFTDNFDYEKYEGFSFFNPNWLSFRKNSEVERYLEIKEYLYRHSIKNYCVVDDLQLGKEYVEWSISYNRDWGFSGRFVKTYDYEGIFEKGIKEKIINTLND